MLLAIEGNDQIITVVADFVDFQNQVTVRRHLNLEDRWIPPVESILTGTVNFGSNTFQPDGAFTEVEFEIAFRRFDAPVRDIAIGSGGNDSDGISGLSRENAFFDFDGSGMPGGLVQFQLLGQINWSLKSGPGVDLVDDGMGPDHDTGPTGSEALPELFGEDIGKGIFLLGEVTLLSDLRFVIGGLTVGLGIVADLIGIIGIIGTMRIVGILGPICLYTILLCSVVLV